MDQKKSLREAAEGEEKESRPPHSSEEEVTEKEEEEDTRCDDSEGDGLMRGRRYREEQRHDQNKAEGEEDMDDGEPKYVRKYFWTRYVDSGFPNRVRGVCEGDGARVNDRS